MGRIGILYWLWKKHTLIPLDGRSYVADDLVNECVLLYKEIKKSLRLNGFINLDGTEIEDEMVGSINEEDWCVSRPVVLL